MTRPRFQEYLDELSCGNAYGVFIDDTGSPGIQNAPPNFHPERKTWVAVIIPPSQISEVMQQLPEALDGLKELVGAEEFHFTDIYSGTKQFKGINLQQRLALFEFMAHIFSLYRFPVIVQTFDPETLRYQRSRCEKDFPDSIPPFDFSKCEDFALFFLLIRIKWFMEKTKNYPNIKARVFVDEGYKKNGIGCRIPTFSNVFSDGQICFAKSSSVLPIQLADFAAFSLNRVQLVGGRDNRKSLDNRILQIMSSAMFNYINLDRKYIPLNQKGPLITLDETRPHGPYTGVNYQDAEPVD